MLFYFTATGNSLYVARQLDQNPISIPQIIQHKDLTFEDETIGIVAPTYAGQLPKMVTEFIQKATFNTDYLYILPTYGMKHSVITEWSWQTAKEAGKSVSYIQPIQMVDNYLPGFDMNEQMAMDKKIDEQLAKVKQDIAARIHEIPTPSESGRAKYEMVQQRFKEHPELNNGEQILITDACIGCGICSKVCPLGNIYVAERKAQRKQTTCEFCLSCAQNCPKKAIIMKIPEKNPNARYRHPEVKLQDIILSNQQK